MAGAVPSQALSAASDAASDAATAASGWQTQTGPTLDDELQREGPAMALVPSWSGPANLPSAELARRMGPLRLGDPLGLGSSERPPAPPDPDPYDRELEDKEFARSLLTEAERKQVDEELEVAGYLTIASVRQIILDQTAKNTVELGGLDPELIAVIDARVNYKVFVAGDNVYSREELYANFPFHEFSIQPEAVFAQQELGVFPPRGHSLTADPEYFARDVGDESMEFLMVEDLVGLATRPTYELRRRPLRVAKTKIYLGKERWEDFLHLQRSCRGAVRVARAQVAYSGRDPEMGGPLPPLFGALTRPVPALTMVPGPPRKGDSPPDSPPRPAGAEARGHPEKNGVPAGPSAPPEAAELRRLETKFLGRAPRVHGAPKSPHPVEEVPAAQPAGMAPSREAPDEPVPEDSVAI